MWMQQHFLEGPCSPKTWLANQINKPEHLTLRAVEKVGRPGQLYSGLAISNKQEASFKLAGHPGRRSAAVSAAPVMLALGLALSLC